MKKLFPLFIFILVCSFSTNAQSSDSYWERKADRIEAWADRLAHRVERKAEHWEERSEHIAEHWEDWAEDVAEDIEDTFDRDWRIEVNGDRIFEDDICHAYLGIHSDRISRSKVEKLGFRNAYGSYVTKVVKGSAAEEAGLQTFDYIYGIDDQRTSNNQDLSDIIADYKPGEEVTLHFVRNNREMSASATFGEYNDFKWSDDDEAFLGIRPHDHERKSDLDGVKVEIVSNSTAEEMGLEDGDVIHKLNDFEILDWDDISAAINSFEPGQTVEVEYERNGNARTVSAPIRSYDDYEEAKEDQYSNSNNNSWDWDWNDDNEDWGNGAFLGIYTDKISQKKARKLGYDNPYGTVVTGVIKGTGAYKAGLQPFDYIYGIDEYRVGEHQSLGGILRKFEPGDNATVHFYRKSNKQKVNLRFGSHADVEKEEKTKCDDPFFGIIQMHNNSSYDGVKVKTVRNSTARSMGLEEGDIITEINGYPMIDWTDIGTAIDMLAPGDKISVKYRRGDRELSATDKITSYADAKNCDNCDCDDNRYVFDIDPEINIVIGDGNRRDRGDREPRVDVDDISVNMESISSSDANEMRSKGVDMPVESNLSIENLNLSPNPNMGMFELEFDLPSEGQTMVRVFNPAGRVIYEYDLGRFSGDFADYIDISQNGEGIYFLQVSQDGNAFTRKVVLSRS